MGLKYKDKLLAKRVFEEANQILNLEKKLEEVMTEGPIDILNDTRYTQPAMLVDGYIQYKENEEEIRSHGGDLNMIGNSLGEVTALLCDGCFDLSTGLDLVRERSRLMDSALRDIETKVITIRDTKEATLEYIEGFFEETGIKREETMIELMLSITPSITMIGGYPDILKEFRNYIKKKGRVRSVAAQTSNAFHTYLLSSIKPKFEEHLKSLDFKPPTNAIWANYTGAPYSFEEVPIDNMVHTLNNPVLFQKGLEEIRESYDQYVFYDIGSNRFMDRCIDEIYPEEVEYDLVTYISLDS